jgi:hypothetical protein
MATKETERMGYALTTKQEMAEATRLAAQLHPPPPSRIASARPRLTTDSVIDYLDWLTGNLHAIDKDLAAVHMAAAELVIRVQMGEAQGKATQHTLVDEGKLKAPGQTP